MYNSPPHTYQPIRAEKGSFTLKEPYNIRPKSDFAGLNKSGLVTCPSNQMRQVMEKEEEEAELILRLRSRHTLAEDTGSVPREFGGGAL